MFKSIYHHFKSFCVDEGLTISQKKTQVVVFNGEKNGQIGKLAVGDDEFEVVKSFKYLGLEFD